MGDALTLLKCRAPLNMAKTWRADDTILPYSSAKFFTPSLSHVDDLDTLSELLETLEGDPRACLIRGALKPEVNLAAPFRRLLENLDDTPLHTLLVDVDGYEPLTADPVRAPLDAIREFITTSLPEAFHDVSFRWQLSNSAGAPGKESLLKAHLWLWSETPYDSATLSAWAKSLDLPIDRAVYRPAQVLYTAAPIIEKGAICPVKQRSGLWRGARDTLPLVIDPEIAVRGAVARQRGERLEKSDPLADHVCKHWETWGELAGGGLLVSCPWESGHSGGAQGDTSSVYFPAGTSGYAEGSYICLHDSCSERGRSDFAQAVGYVDSQLSVLADISDLLDAPLNGKHVAGHLNGRLLNDPLLLPAFIRDKQGIIKTCLENMVIGLKSRRAVDADFSFDNFRGELLIAEGPDAWRPMGDGDAVQMRIRLERLGFDPIGRENMRDALSRVSDDVVFDSATKWLCDVVPEWDGVERIATFWPRYMQTKDTPYTRALGRYSWTAQAGRVLEPGAKADMVPVLVSPEGYLKSTAISLLAPSTEFFAEFRMDAKDEDLSRLMRGCLVGELAELRGIGARDGEAVLAWVTRRDEKWTPKFKEYAITLPRRLVFYATTNDKQFLSDHMGQRRWLPVTIEKMIDIAPIETDRMQLWAEARETWRRSGIAWREVEALAVAERPAYQADDPLRGAVARWLDTPGIDSMTPRGKGQVTMLMLAEGLGIRASQLQAVTQRRLGSALRAEGFVDVAPSEDKKRVWESI